VVPALTTTAPEGEEIHDSTLANVKNDHEKLLADREKREWSRRNAGKDKCGFTEGS
jgi:hypothetical protein